MDPTYVMLQTRTGSPNGIIINTYRAGEEYPLPLDLATVFVREGWAVPADQLHGDTLPEAEDRETAADGPLEPDLCGVMTTRGEPCRRRRPCPWHKG